LEPKDVCVSLTIVDDVTMKLCVCVICRLQDAASR